MFVHNRLTSILVSSVGSFFSYVNDARSHEPEVHKEKTQQVCTRMTLTGRRMCCLVRESNPAP